MCTLVYRVEVECSKSNNLTDNSININIIISSSVYLDKFDEEREREREWVFENKAIVVCELDWSINLKQQNVPSVTYWVWYDSNKCHSIYSENCYPFSNCDLRSCNSYLVSYCLSYIYTWHWVSRNILIHILSLSLGQCNVCIYLSRVSEAHFTHTETKCLRVHVFADGQRDALETTCPRQS